MMKEEDAMVYRRPYLTSGSSGFALNALSGAMKKELKVDYPCRSSYHMLPFQLFNCFSMIIYRSLPRIT